LIAPVWGALGGRTEWPLPYYTVAHSRRRKTQNRRSPLAAGVIWSACLIMRHLWRYSHL